MEIPSKAAGYTATPEEAKASTEAPWPWATDSHGYECSSLIVIS